MGWGTGGVSGQGSDSVTLSWWTHDIVHLSKPTERTAPRANPNANCGLQLIITYQWVLNCNKCTSQCEMFIGGELCMGNGVLGTFYTVSYTFL